MILSNKLTISVYFLFLISGQAWSQQGQQISFGGIYLNIPTDWFYQTNSYPNGNQTIESGKKGESNSFTINKINADLSTREGVDASREMLAKIDFFKTASYSEYKTGMFNGNSSLETTFTNNFQGTIFKGKIIAFKKEKGIFVIMYMGDETYFNGKLLQNILSSVRVD